ncbi:(2Fe-2S) ferredoxin domain-containing protein [Paenibacillus senegalensis]|uniref:(2Fe-2S) ferredoxin domain-containing protein n=1 Tax=Paenibacillus senegalensis TaxID=1465766 RepID=UPI000287D4F1|nr:(2Fe-2S) ferredoxin domain-containing protein [Paenibacillus senegalensis]
MTTWNLQETSCHLLICNGGSCMMRQAEEVTQAIRDEIALLGADKRIHTTRTRCNGRCADACVVIAYPDGIWYKDISPESGRKIVRKHLVGKRLDEQIAYTFDHHFIASGRSVAGKEKIAGRPSLF